MCIDGAGGELKENGKHHVHQPQQPDDEDSIMCLDDANGNEEKGNENMLSTQSKLEENVNSAVEKGSGCIGASGMLESEADKGKFGREESATIKVKVIFIWTFINDGMSSLLKILQIKTADQIF